MDCKELSQKLNELIKMEKEPVAIKIYADADEAKEELPKYDGQARHCQLVHDASVKKESFYVTVDEQKCPNGNAALGLVDKELPNIPQIPALKEAVGYAPLSEATFTPDVVVIYATPVQALTVAQFYRTATKKRFEADFNGTASLCADVVAEPFLTNESNMSLGCNGSRSYSDIKDEEMVIGLTLADAEAVVKFL